MNLLVFPTASRIDSDRIRITGRQLEHLRKVHRAQVGDSLRVGELEGWMGSGHIEHLDDQAALLRIELTQPPPPKLPLKLILALPRPKMLRRILSQVASLGVAEIVLINSARVEKSYWQTPFLEENNIRDYFLQGLEQARDTHLPRLDIQRYFKPYVEDKLPLVAQTSLALAAHPGSYPECPKGLEQAVTLAIGPEGGWVPYEVELFQASGFRLVQLGERILQVEVAIINTIARLF